MKRLIYFLPVFLIALAFTACETDMNSNRENISLKSGEIVDPPECVEETAWVYGPRYVARGNWATYTPIPEIGTNPNFSCVDIFAGQHMLAGHVCFTPYSDPGYVKLKFWLDPCWSLQDVEEAIKIQGYNEPPSGNPAPGRFITYKGIGELGATGYIYVIVPVYAYYGIHLDLTNCCE